VFAFSPENDGQGPEISMANNLSEVLLGQQPGGCDLTFDHGGITLAGHVVRSLLNATLRALMPLARWPS
jgi:hypothetical protein